MKPYNDCTPEEIDNYNRAQQETADTHTRGISKMILRNLQSGVSEEEREENIETIADLRADVAILRARREAYYANRSRIEPPTNTQLQALRNNLNNVNRLTIKRNVTRKVVVITTKALNSFKEIQPA